MERKQCRGRAASWESLASMPELSKMPTWPSTGFVIFHSIGTGKTGGRPSWAALTLKQGVAVLVSSGLQWNTVLGQRRWQTAVPRGSGGWSLVPRQLLTREERPHWWPLS